MSKGGFVLSGLQFDRVYMQRAALNASRHAVGTLGELIAQKLLKDNGYYVQPVEKGQGLAGLRAIDQDTGQVFDVEVKTARRGKDRKWRFKLWKAGHTDHRKADVVILIALTKAGRAVSFIVPCSELTNQKQAVITSHPEDYGGKLAKFRRKMGDAVVLNA